MNFKFSGLKQKERTNEKEKVGQAVTESVFKRGPKKKITLPTSVPSLKFKDDEPSSEGETDPQSSPAQTRPKSAEKTDARPQAVTQMQKRPSAEEARTFPSHLDEAANENKKKKSEFNIRVRARFNVDLIKYLKPYVEQYAQELMETDNFLPEALIRMCQIFLTEIGQTQDLTIEEEDPQDYIPYSELEKRARGLEFLQKSLQKEAIEWNQIFEQFEDQQNSSEPPPSFQPLPPPTFDIETVPSNILQEITLQTDKAKETVVEAGQVLEEGQEWKSILHQKIHLCTFGIEKDPRDTLRQIMKE